MQSELSKAYLRLEASPFNSIAQSQVSSIRHELKKVDLYEAKGAQLRARMHWLKVGDRVTKEFFQRLKPPAQHSQFQDIQVDG